MDEQSKKLIAQLQQNPAMLRSLMHSSDGKALMQLLTKDDGGASLQKAATSAAMGNPAQMVEMVSNVMKSTAGAQLVERINQSVRK